MRTLMIKYMKNVRQITSGCRNSLGSEIQKNLARSMSTDKTSYNFNTLKVTSPCEYVLNVELNRPEKRNAMTIQLWNELDECFKKITTDKDCRAVVLSAAGKLYSAGIDFSSIGSIAGDQASEDPVRKGASMYPLIRNLQQSFSSIERCPKPVITAVQGGCIGAGVDLIAACDIRYCTQDAYFQIKEVDVGIAADLGTLQRLPKIMGNDSFVREMIYTCKKVGSEEAKQVGIVSKISADKDCMLKDAIETASIIASKSPIAVQGSKINVLYSRDHSVEDGLEFNARWSMFALQSEDLMKAGMAAISKSGPPTFSKL